MTQSDFINQQEKLVDLYGIRAVLHGLECVAVRKSNLTHDQDISYFWSEIAVTLNAFALKIDEQVISNLKDGERKYDLSQV